MIAYRAVLASAVLAFGIIVLVRVLAFGVRTETLPGIVLAAAMVALGIYRLSQIARIRRKT